jgi:hypothetical protein
MIHKEHALNLIQKIVGFFTGTLEERKRMEKFNLLAARLSLKLSEVMIAVPTYPQKKDDLLAHLLLARGKALEAQVLIDELATIKSPLASINSQVEDYQKTLTGIRCELDKQIKWLSIPKESAL